MFNPDNARRDGSWVGGAVMAIFIVLGILAVRKFHPLVTSAAKSTPY
jgi:hypothetical protein